MLTVGELRAKLADLQDDMPVLLDNAEYEQLSEIDEIEEICRLRNPRNGYYYYHEDTENIERIGGGPYTVLTAVLVLR